jgi:predicted ATPase
MAQNVAGGGVVSRSALMARVWPDRVVDENNLQSQISALRAAFGAERDLIRTVSGRGYQFTGEVRVPAGSPGERAAVGMAAQPAGALPLTNLPAPVSELIGRDAEVAEVVSLVGAHRLVSLTGIGGIGKTQLALTAARQLLPHFTGGVWLAELSPLSDPGLVPATVATAVGLELGGGEVSAQRVAQALADRRLLLVLDTCEHVITAATGMVEALLHANPAAHVIATSREPLKAEGEWIYPVPPLAVPAAEDDDFWRSGAALLFVLRSRASGAHIPADRHSGNFIVTICRRLDGIPLAIELAAARGGVLGIEELAAGLDDRFRLLTGGRRTALPRHQTLRATLDWSYELLSEPERVILRRIAIFAGAFILDGASAVVASPELPQSEVVEGLATLAAKSLVVAEVDGRVARYRLLDTTRAYAIEKLGESGEGERLARRHAEYYRDVFERAEAALDARSTVEWLDDYGRQIDNLRAALDWAFSPHGEVAIGAALTAAAVPLWMHLSLLDECRTRVVRALAAIEAGTNPDRPREMKLHAALGGLLMYSHNAKDAVPGAGAAWTRALEIAESLDDAEYRLTSLWGLWFFRFVSSEHRTALELAERFCALAANWADPNYRLVGERMMAVPQHYLGDLPSARRRLDRALGDYVTPNYTSPVLRFQFRPHVAARVLLAWSLWLEGFPDQAMRAAENSVEEARGANHVISLCYALSQVCPMALLAGDLDTAEPYLTMLVDQAARHSLPLWAALGRSNQGVLLIKRGDVDDGLRLLRAGHCELGEGGVAWSTLWLRPSGRSITFCMVTAEALARTGQIGDGLILLEAAIDHCERTEERWVFAELLRVKGQLLLLQGGSSAAATAEDNFRQALDWARRQGALSWELRAATRLAQLLRDQGRAADAVVLLHPIYDRFTEGFDTVDLKTAKALLDSLRE